MRRSDTERTDIKAMAFPTLIYCANGNRRYAQIAIDAGYQYGAQLPGVVYHPVYFADQDWKKPNRMAYMAALAEHHPTMATVLDWEQEDQLNEVLDWAEAAAQYAERVLIIPKVQGGISKLPRTINGKDVVLAYSVPTRYGGTALPLWDFAGWPVHLLGGSPEKQMKIYQHIAGITKYVSVDGNMHMKMATQFCKFWRKQKGEKGHWVSLKETGDGDFGKDATYEAFRRSCHNIMAEWQAIEGLRVEA